MHEMALAGFSIQAPPDAEILFHAVTSSTIEDGDTNLFQEDWCPDESRLRDCVMKLWDILHPRIRARRTMSPAIIGGLWIEEVGTNLEAATSLLSATLWARMQEVVCCRDEGFSPLSMAT